MMSPSQSDGEDEEGHLTDPLLFVGEFDFWVWLLFGALVLPKGFYINVFPCIFCLYK